MNLPELPDAMPNDDLTSFRHAQPEAVPKLMEEPAVAWLRSENALTVYPFRRREQSLSDEAAVHSPALSSCTSPVTRARPTASSLDRLSQTVTATAPAADGTQKCQSEAELEQFFEGLAAGESMDSLVHVLQNVMRVHYQKLLSSASTSSSEAEKHAQAAPVPVSVSRRRALRPAELPFTRAITAAMVFAVESPAAAAEATELYFSPSAGACVREEHTHASGSSRTQEEPLAASLCRYPAMKALPVRPRAVRHMLSDRAASALARSYWQEDRHLGRSRDWRRALGILTEAQPSRATASTWIQMYSRGGDWQRAIRVMESYVPAAEWGQRELSACIRAVYHAARDDQHVPRAKGRRGQESRSRLTGGAAPSDALVQLPVTLMMKAARAREAAVMSPSAAFQCASSRQSTTNVEGQMDAEAEHALPSALNDALGLLSLRPDMWRDACTLLDCFVLAPSEEVSAENTHESGMSEAEEARRRAWRTRPNAVTLYQACQALRADSATALQYASRLLRVNPDIARERDPRATTSYLENCVEASQWAAAMHVVEQQMSSEPASRDGNAMPLTHVAPDTLLRLVHLFNQQQASRDVSQRIAEHMAYSKHYNPRTRSRALNSLLQYSQTIAEAESYHDQLIAAMRDSPHANTASHVPSAVVENESLVHLAHLYSRGCEWEKALLVFRALLDEPRRRLSYVPSAQTHDEVQFALAQASPPGPSWTVALSLFLKVCADRSVPVSAVAFRAVSLRCLDQGATSQYEGLMRFLVQRGVGRV